MAKIDYVNSDEHTLTQHFKNATKQVVYDSQKRYANIPAVLLKIRKAIIKGKIARLQDELLALETQHLECVQNG